MVARAMEARPGCPAVLPSTASLEEIDAGDLTALAAMLAKVFLSALLTVDTNLRRRQHSTNRRIAIVILQSFSNRLEHRQYFPDCWSAVEKIKHSEIVLAGSSE